MVNCCGLLTAQKEPVPLKSVDVELEVRDHVATVVSTLNYENKEDKPLEAVFVFPLPGDAAVCHFSAKLRQTQIVAEVKEKQKAREDYDDALSSGQQAFLLEESEQSPDIFSMSVGCLPPGESASIRLEYVTELSVQADDGLRFCLPAVLNPRYQPQGSGGSGSGNAQVTSTPASLVPYTLTFSAQVSSPRPVSRIESSCSLDPLQYLNSEQTKATIKLAAGHKFDRDVELLIYYKDAHQPTAVVETGEATAKLGTLMGDPVVMLSLYPEFPQAVMSSVASCGEFVFLLDRSGSMGAPMNNSKTDQTRISSARDTLLLLLKSLPMGCYFNIYSFGSSYEHIFPKSVEYSQQTMEEALKKVGEMESNLGGTEILRPLEHIYNQPCIQNQPRQVFVFTDGEVGNTKQVIDLAKKNSHAHRCFSFGIGEGASSALINGLAKEGGGHAQFITGTDRMQPKVMQSLRYALQPAVVDISVTWDMPKDVSVTVLSPPITALFQGQRSLVYARLSGQISEAAEGCVTVKYSLAGHPSQNQLQFSLKPAENTGLTVHRLAARTLIRCLEMEEREPGQQQDDSVRKKVVELSVQSGVSSAFTAFIAVNKDSGEAIQGPLVRRNVPTARLMACSMPYSLSLCSAQPSFKTSMMLGSAGSSAPNSVQYGMNSMDLQSGLTPCSMSISLPSYSAQPHCRKIRECCDSMSSGPDSVETDGMDLQSAKPTSKSFIGGLFGFKAKKTVKLSGTRPFDSGECRPCQPPMDPLLQVVSLQKASGCWDLAPALATALGKTSEEMEKPKPASVNQEVWATILSLIWLHGFKMDSQEEWELLAMKAVSWVRAQNSPCVNECVEAGNALLGCKVQKDALGL
ncbi:von Willebrand factor A domain-containing protein 5A-like isoform X3 [Notolabrus celidotus]|uniref:von Willebrand factor A domain-containing protein 5A-like isoform X3 n=1 Tax=Notolabrus celidotus TaxID=1203425 RepID=UPI00148FDAEB|nr:von Willebrand factor A domain-containing protein 5A-like isoform X3 [Notolabrus celidotus]